jgi:hypothetical protein
MLTTATTPGSFDLAHELTTKGIQKFVADYQRTLRRSEWWSVDRRSYRCLRGRIKSVALRGFRIMGCTLLTFFGIVPAAHAQSQAF